MTQTYGRRWMLGSPLAVSALLLAGCMGSPTYGTGKRADAQLLEDVTGILSVSPTAKERIAYSPRPTLVKPASTAALPAPQEKIADAANGQWPESPEQRRARIRADATANLSNPNYESEIIDDMPKQPTKYPTRYGRDGDYALQSSPAQQRAEFNKRLAEGRQGNPNSRKYLSEPPLTYRAAAADAPVGDVGEDEWKKEKRIKKMARKKGSTSWSDFLPSF